MGSQTTTQQTTPQPTSTETALMGNELSLSNAALPGQIQNTIQSQGLIGNLLQGGNLPGYLNNLPGGVSQAQSQNEAQLGLQGLATTFQSQGGLDSGSYAQAGANAYANTLNSNAQFNVENLANLLNLASGQAYNNAGTTSQNNSALGSQSGALAGTSGTSTIFANPFSQAISANNSINDSTNSLAALGLNFCWVAAEVFDGWSDIRTIQSRFYLMFYAPKWFRNIYSKYGKKIANHIHNKPILKLFIKPLFELFSLRGKEKLNGKY